MSDMKLALDIDGVLANWVHAIRGCMARVAGRPNDVPELEDAPCWDFAGDYGYTKEQFSEARKRAYSDGSFWATLPAYPGVGVFLDWLWRAVSTANWNDGGSHEVYFMSDRTGHRVKDQTEIWLKRHGFGGKDPTVLITPSGKGRILADLKITHFIDDKPQNVVDARTFAPDCETTLLSRRWNVSEQPYLQERGVIVVPTLKDFQRRLSSEF